MKRILILLIFAASLASGLHAGDDRWLEMMTTQDKETVYIDSQTLDYQNAPDGSLTGVKAWIKWVAPSGSYDLTRDEFSGHRFRLLAIVRYSADGHVIENSYEAGAWADMAPGSIAESIARFLLVDVPAYFREHKSKSSYAMPRKL